MSQDLFKIAISAALEASEKGFQKLMQGLGLLKSLKTTATTSFGLMSWIQRCYDAMNDDFNTPVLIAHLFEGIKYINLINDGKETITAADLVILSDTFKAFVFDVLGLSAETEAANSDKLNGTIELLIKLRKEARDNKNWALSDQIRDELIRLEIQLKDGKEGTTYTVN